MLEQHADGFTVVDAADGLAKDGRDVNDLELGAQAAVLVLGHRVCDEHLINGRGVDARNGVAAEDAVRQQGIDLGGALLLEQLGCARDGVGGIGEIVDEDADAVGDVADKHHASVFLLGELDGTAFL